MPRDSDTDANNSNGLNIASNETSSFQMIIDITGVHGAIVLMQYVWVHIRLRLYHFKYNHNNCFQKLTNKYTKKLGIFN